VGDYNTKGGRAERKERRKGKREKGGERGKGGEGGKETPQNKFLVTAL